MLWPLFARAPCHWFLEICLLSSPGVQSDFVFFVAPRWAPRPFGGARAKNKRKHHPGCVFFFAAAAAKGRGRRSPVGRRHGAREKKKTPCGPAQTLTHSLRAWAAMPPAGVVFLFLLRPRPDRGGVFCLLWPRPDANSRTVGWGDFGKARVVFLFFLLRPRRTPITKNVWCTTSGLKRQSPVNPYNEAH